MKFTFNLLQSIMWITYDPVKREQTLASRGLDFADASIVLDGEHLIIPDTRKNYGETRFVCYGFSMRKANEREKRRFTHLLRK